MKLRITSAPINVTSIVLTPIIQPHWTAGICLSPVQRSTTRSDHCSIHGYHLVLFWTASSRSTGKCQTFRISNSVYKPNRVPAFRRHAIDCPIVATCTFPLTIHSPATQTQDIVLLFALSSVPLHWTLPLRQWSCPSCRRLCWVL